MFKLTFFLTLLLPADFCFSQDTSKADVVDITKINVLYPRVSYEKRIRKFQSLYFSGYLFIGPSGAQSEFGSPPGVYFDPALLSQYRYYYNSAQRQSKGKRTAMNSMNYIGAEYGTMFSKMSVTQWAEEPARRAVHTVGLIWGMQRNYAKGFSLDFNFGPGYTLAKETPYRPFGHPEKATTKGIFTVIAEVNIGIWLNKKITEQVFK